MWQKAPSLRVMALVSVAAGLGVLSGCSQFDQPTPRYWEVREIAPPITAIEVAPQFGQPTFTAGGPPVFAGMPPDPRATVPLPVMMGGEPAATGPFHHRHINRTYRMGAQQATDVVPSGAPYVAPQMSNAPTHVFQPGQFQQLTTDHSYSVYGGTYPLMDETPRYGMVGAQDQQQYAQAHPLYDVLPPNDPNNPLHQVPQRAGSVELGPPRYYAAPVLAPVSRQPPSIVVQGQPYVHGAPGIGTGMPPRAAGYIGQYDEMRGGQGYATAQQQMPAAGYLDPRRDPARPEPVLLDGVRPNYPLDPRMSGPGMSAGGYGVVGSIAGQPGQHPAYGAHDPLDAGATFRYPAQPVHGSMQGLLTAPQTGPGAVGTSFIDPTTGHPRDFRHVVLTPETMDPRNVNRRALDRMSAMSLRGYTEEKTLGNGTMRAPAGNPTQGMTGAKAAPYWQMIADDIAEQMFYTGAPGREFFYVEPGTAFRNRVPDNVFRDHLAKALRQRGAQIAPGPEYATAFVRIKVDMFDLNPLAFSGRLNPPDYTPLFRDSGHMMLVLDRGVTETRGRDLVPTNNPNLGYPTLSGTDPFLRPFTGIMASGLIERRGKAAYRVHGAYYIDRGDL